MPLIVKLLAVKVVILVVLLIGVAIVALLVRPTVLGL